MGILRICVQALLVLGHFSLPASGKDSRQLTLLTEENLPWSYSHPETGELVGSFVEIAQELMKRTDISYTLTKLPWNRSYQRALNDTNTCTFAMNKTPEREKLFQFVSPFMVGGWSIFKKPGSTIEISKIEDVRPYSIVGKRDSSAVKALEELLGIEVVTTTGDERAAKMLFNGRSHLWLSGVVDGPKASLAAGLPKPETALAWKSTELGMGCSLKTDPKLMQAMLSEFEGMQDFIKTALTRH